MTQAASLRAPANGRTAQDLAPAPLLACLAYVVKEQGVAFSPEAALAGLPLAPGQPLDAALFPRAAAQFGFKSEAVARLPSQLSSLVVPFVVATSDGQAVVVTDFDKDAGRALVVSPGISDASRSVALADLDAQAAQVLLIARDEQHVHEAGAAASGHWFWSPMARLWPSWLQVTLAALLVNILGLAVPIFVMSVYDRVIPNQSQATLWALTTGVLLALIFDVALRQLRAAVLDQAGTLVDMAASSRLFRQALAIPLAHRPQSPGALAAQVRDFETVREFFSSSTIAAFTDLLFVVVVGLVMYALVGSLALVPLLALPIVIGLTMLLQWPMSQAVSTTQAQGTRRHAILIESLAAIETVKASTAEGLLQKRWEEAVAASARASSSAKLWSTLNINLITLVQQLVTIVVVVWGVFLSMEGQITIGGIIAASMLSARVLGPIGNIAMVMSRGQAALASLRSLNALMQGPAENSGLRVGNRVEDGGLEFRGVSFTYPEAPLPALENLSFRIGSGERVGLLGRVGSGKSTLGKLAAGLWTAKDGLILVGGRDSRSLESAELRACVGLMAQEVELLSGTLYDNLVLGLRHVDEGELMAACEVAGLAELARRSPQGLKLPVGERGRALSGGQRQMVALARVLLRNPRLLVLDEPSSALDTMGELDLVRRLKEWTAARGTTLLVSSQRLAMLDLCDRLIVLDQGRLVADGAKVDVIRMLSSHPVQPAAGGST